MMKFFNLLLFSLLFIPLAGGITAEDLNRAFGINLVSAENRWELAELQKRSKLFFRGTNNRFNLKARLTIAGAPMEEMMVYTTGEKKLVTRITIVFANKGDTTGRYQGKIKDAERTIFNLLSGVCGKRQRGDFTIGASKVRADSWQTPFAGIYLEVKRKKFLMLHIIPPAETGGGSSSNGAIKKDYTKNVVRNDFGDVCIVNIPMVDQGNKGYCVPASAARVFLYFGINLDMHRLADIGGTGRNSGTNFNRMMRQMALMRRQNGLRQENFSSLALKSLKRYIDQGYPVLWQMHSTDELNSLYAFSRSNRPKAASPREWAKTIKRRTVSRSRTNGHVCLIIGYNMLTDEIAVSNSWGESHTAPTWIPLNAAKKVSQNQLAVLFP